MSHEISARTAVNIREGVIQIDPVADPINPIKYKIIWNYFNVFALLHFNENICIEMTENVAFLHQQIDTLFHFNLFISFTTLASGVLTTVINCL